MSPSSSQLTAAARQVVLNFGQQPGVSASQARCLEQAVIGTPLVIDQLNAATERGAFVGFEALPPGSGYGGTYQPDRQTISIPLDILAPDDRPETIFILGHELQHALNCAGVDQSGQAFGIMVDHAATSDRDYTQALSAMLLVHRDDEASANLMGWNAYVSHARVINPQATLKAIADSLGSRADDFVAPSRIGRRPRARAGLKLSADLTFDLTRKNIEAMGHYYVDKAPDVSQLGANRNSDYANHYAANLIGWTGKRHHDTQIKAFPWILPNQIQPMIINLAELKLDHQLLEQNGIDLEGAPPVPFIDQSTYPPTHGVFYETKSQQNSPTVASSSEQDQHLEAVRLARLSFARSAANAVRQQPRSQITAGRRSPARSPDRARSVITRPTR